MLVAIKSCHLKSGDVDCHPKAGEEEGRGEEGGDEGGEERLGKTTFDRICNNPHVAGGDSRIEEIQTNSFEH